MKNQSKSLIISILLLANCINTRAEKDSDPSSTTCTEDGSVCFASDEAKRDYYYKGVNIPLDFGDDQVVAGDEWAITLGVIQKTKEYMKQVAVDDKYKEVRDECRVRHESCSFWAGIGECENNPAYMLINCAPSCQTCDQISYEVRCPFETDAPGTWGPGDLNKMFERITSDPKNKENLTILSQPPKGPWVITLDNFLTDEECDTLIRLGDERGYERSRDVGEKKFDGSYDSKESKDRTSTNAWCVEECYEHEVTQNILEKITNYTEIPEENYEFLQLLQYEENQQYKSHHDYIDHHTARAPGVRIMTVFLYLNDVEAGGGTHFSDLDITVGPKRGRVLLWPSVLDSNPDAKDFKTHHAALPVEAGIKYGANAWVHQRDFKTAYRKSCV